MKILFDTNIWEAIYTLLHKRGVDVDWVGHWAQRPTDQELLAYALEHKKILVTLGEDLSYLIEAQDLPHYGVLQLPSFATGKKQAEQCIRLLKACHRDLLSGSLVTLNTEGVSVHSTLPSALLLKSLPPHA